MRRTHRLAAPDGSGFGPSDPRGKTDKARIRVDAGLVVDPVVSHRARVTQGPVLRSRDQGQPAK